MTRNEQEQAANKWKATSERAFYNAFIKWNKRVSAEWRPGMYSLSREARAALNALLEEQLTAASNRVLGFDLREYKDLETDIRINSSRDMANKINHEVVVSSNSISNTVGKFMQVATAEAISETGNVRSGRAVLSSKIRSQSITIATTEAQWATETARGVYVLNVTDPLRNTIQQIVNLIETGDMAGAVRLSNEVIALIGTPTSVTQGEIINFIKGATQEMFDPIVQAEAIANLRRAAAALEKAEKEWLTIGDDLVREEHHQANGQTTAVEQPFQLISGDRLQYPGDGSLGASLGQIINCRCATLYV